jgi:hypothetical protein
MFSSRRADVIKSLHLTIPPTGATARISSSHENLRHIWTRRRCQGTVELLHERGQMQSYIRPVEEGCYEPFWP